MKYEIFFSQRLILALARRLDRRKPWHQRGKILGGISLYAVRLRLRTWNLWDTERLPAAEAQPAAVNPTERQRRARSTDGRYNDLDRPNMGEAGTRFGRNMPFQRFIPLEDLLEPNPRLVSDQLMARNGEFKAVPFLNLLAAAWIQFQVHDWAGHDNQSADPIEFPVAPTDPWGSRLCSSGAPNRIRHAITMADRLHSKITPATGGMGHSFMAILQRERNSPWSRW